MLYLTDSFDHYYVRPELVYLTADGNIDEKENETAKNFTNLSPLVVYSSRNEDSDQEQDVDDCIEYVTENVETEIIEGDEDQKFLIHSQGESGLENCSEGANGQLVEPMMPFFLTDPSVFTILNENNEVGVSIINLKK